MVRITDITLSCIDHLPHDKADLLRFLDFLIATEVDAIELSERMRELLSPLPDFHSYILPGNKARLRGLGDALCGDYLQTFIWAKKSFNGGDAASGGDGIDDIEFCPSNGYRCATALAAEWVISGAGNNVASSFGGIGGNASTEELIMILRMNGLRKADKTYEFFPEMARLFCKITGENMRSDKPVIGEKIFNVESGVHVDGILKQPECYEPYPPEAVGQKREIVLGKQSGTASIRAKLSELNMQCAEGCIPRILERVKAAASIKNGAVSMLEFAEIVKSKSFKSLGDGKPEAVGRRP
ncbi:MAG: hypothetical protein LBH93_04200 [Chitinispirillales bacterium]|jgi:homocitrate synthase NifV|nr:hypothetical protein [Chitinispirillales bacterium]